MAKPRDHKRDSERPEILEGAPLRYAPENELGVVFLFSSVSKKLGFHVERVRPSFPDCIAYRKVGGKEKMVRIEFEFKSKNFKNHRHSAKECDCIVCWEHDWPGLPDGIEIIELRKEFGMGFNVWIQPVSGGYAKKLADLDYSECWSVPSLAHEGDLILFYRTRPDACVVDIFRLEANVRHVDAGWKAGKDYMGSIRRVCRLKSPIFFEELKADRILKTASFVRGQMQGRPKVTEYWPHLHDMIVRRNPSARKALSRFAPDK